MRLPGRGPLRDDPACRGAARGDGAGAGVVLTGGAALVRDDAAAAPALAGAELLRPRRRAAGYRQLAVRPDSARRRGAAARGVSRDRPAPAPLGVGADLGGRTG